MELEKNTPQFTSIDRENYLKSFNKIMFVDDNTLVIAQKYMIKRVENFSSRVFTLSSLNAYWKIDLTFNTSFDKAELENITDNEKYGVRIMNFTLWGQEKLLGQLSIKLGYENNEHEASEKIAEFFHTDIHVKINKVKN
ncbi:MAG: hypothetical protein UHG91_08805 [Succinivibrionaceae bacterium]|nr:hypothetical protein [Succinivibrionaceae bacterium]